MDISSKLPTSRGAKSKLYGEGVVGGGAEAVIW